MRNKVCLFVCRCVRMRVCVCTWMLVWFALSFVSFLCEQLKKAKTMSSSAANKSIIGSRESKGSSSTENVLFVDVIERLDVIMNSQVRSMHGGSSSLVAATFSHHELPDVFLGVHHQGFGAWIHHAEKFPDGNSNHSHDPAFQYCSWQEFGLSTRMCVRVLSLLQQVFFPILVQPCKVSLTIMT